MWKTSYYKLLKNVFKNIRIAISELHKNGVKNTKIASLLKVPRMTVWRAIKRFKEVGSYSNRLRIGRPRTARFKKTVKAVAEKIRRYPNRSMQKMSNFTQNWLKDNVEKF